MICWEESIMFGTWVNCWCQIWTNIYKVLIELIDKGMQSSNLVFESGTIY